MNIKRTLTIPWVAGVTACVIASLGCGGITLWWTMHIHEYHERIFHDRVSTMLAHLAAKAALTIREHDDLGLSDLVDHVTVTYPEVLSMAIVDASGRYVVHSDASLTNQSASPPAGPAIQRVTGRPHDPPTVRAWMSLPTPATGALVLYASRERLDLELRKMAFASLIIVLACTAASGLIAVLLSRRLHKALLTVSERLVLTTDRFCVPESSASPLLELQALDRAIIKALSSPSTAIGSPEATGADYLALLQSALHQMPNVGLLAISRNVIVAANPHAAEWLGRDPAGAHVVDAFGERGWLPTFEPVLSGQQTKALIRSNGYMINLVAVPELPRSAVLIIARET